MKCENCNDQIDGSYGSGRFCNSKCAKSFSTKHKRQEINQVVSKKMKGRPLSHNKGFKNGFDERRRLFDEKDRCKAVKVLEKQRKEFYATAEWDELPFIEKRRRVFNFQKGKCLFCKTKEWLGKPLTLELDHVNGDNTDNRRENLRFLCPNCHSQTPTYRRKNRKNQSQQCDQTEGF
jgi:5-methylcytosine-specific restriction endonuclease McrA